MVDVDELNVRWISGIQNFVGFLHSSECEGMKRLLLMFELLAVIWHWIRIFFFNI